MYGVFWSYRGGFNGCIPEVRSESNYGYPDRFGNIRPQSSRKRGETVREWIRREVRDAVLAVKPEVHPIVDGRGFIIGHRRTPWYRGRCFDVLVDPDPAERGRYRVLVAVYTVDLVKH